MNYNNYSQIPGPAANVNVPVYTVTCQVTDDDNNVLADFTGQNALQFPGVLSTLTPAQYNRVMDEVGPLLVNLKAGLE